MSKLRRAGLLRLAGFLCACLLAGGTAAAPDTSLTIAYQGYLADLKAQPIDGTRQIVFTLHSGASGGDVLWEETHEAVAVAKGVFNVMLGSVQTLEVSIFDNARWLGIRVSGEEFEMAPRQRLGSAPFAFIAQRANALSVNATIQGSQITGTITGATVPGVAPWVAISGASQQAVSNTSYMATSASHVTVTLPAAPAVGDVVKVASAGGWTIVRNPGQSIVANVVPAPAWIPRDSTRNWWGVASSADGMKLVAAEFGGLLYTSINGGVDWTPRDSARSWTALASSADGTKLVAAVRGGQLYTSGDSGVSWVPQEQARYWIAVASSADGMKLVALENPGGIIFPNPGGLIYTSPDGGATWFPQESLRAWVSVASSADGAKLVAAVQSGQLHTSPDSGVNWTARDSARIWASVASSADGTKLVAVADKGDNGVYTSIDSGVTWIPRGQTGNWARVSSSADGTRLLGLQGTTTVSMDGGLTWTDTGPAGVSSVEAIVISPDGHKLVAGVRPGRIYTADVSTISGAPYAAIELVYSGGGQWVAVNQQGLLTMP